MLNLKKKKLQNQKMGESNSPGISTKLQKMETGKEKKVTDEAWAISNTQSVPIQFLPINKLQAFRVQSQLCTEGPIEKYPDEMVLKMKNIECHLQRQEMLFLISEYKYVRSVDVCRVGG